MIRRTLNIDFVLSCSVNPSGVVHIFALIQCRRYKLEGVKLGERGKQEAGPHLPIQLLGHLIFNCAMSCFEKCGGPPAC